MLQGEFGEIGLDGINGEEVSVCYIGCCHSVHFFLCNTSYRIMYACFLTRSNNKKLFDKRVPSVCSCGKNM